MLYANYYTGGKLKTTKDAITSESSIPWMEYLASTLVSSISTVK